MKKIFLAGTLLLILLLNAAPAFAQTQQKPFCQGGTCTYVPLEPLPGLPQSGTADFPALLAGFFKLMITFGSLFAVVMLTVAGIGYMLSEAAVDIDKAKKRAKAALWGLLLLAMCWLILYTINPKLLQFDIFKKSLGELAPPSNTAGTMIKNVTVTTSNLMQPKTWEQGIPEAQVMAEANAYIQQCEKTLGGKASATETQSSVTFSCLKK